MIAVLTMLIAISRRTRNRAHRFAAQRNPRRDAAELSRASRKHLPVASHIIYGQTETRRA
jgi:hypothetical protein